MRTFRTLAVLSIVLLILISTLAVNRVSAQTSPRPTREVVTCPAGYASTPRLCVPQECVFGDVSFLDSATGEMRFSNGTLYTMPAHCMNGSGMATVTTYYSDGSVVSRTISSAPFPTNNWVEDAKYASCSWFGCSQWSGENGEWHVPTSPTNNNGQTIYLFIGLTDFYEWDIIQPVIQYGSTTGCGNTFGGAYWGFASYAVGPGYCVYSTFYRANAGDDINGAIYQNGICGHTCIAWTIQTYDATTGQISILNNNNQAMYNAYVTLEVYSVVNCGDYPAAHTHFTSLSVGGGNPGWGAQIRQNDGCGEAVNIISSSQVDLWY